MLFLTVVAVAQLVESRIVIPVVVGSSPIGHPKLLFYHRRQPVDILSCFWTKNLIPFILCAPATIIIMQ